jgi:hypothetical protein
MLHQLGIDLSHDRRIQLVLQSKRISHIAIEAGRPHDLSTHSHIDQTNDHANAPQGTLNRAIQDEVSTLDHALSVASLKE